MKKIFKKIFSFLITIIIIFTIFTYLFSLKSDIPFANTIAYLNITVAKLFNSNNFKNNIANSNSEIMTTLNNKHYYYNQLNDTSKIMYSALENNIDNLRKINYTINFGTTFDDLLNTTTGQYKLNSAFQSTLDAFFYDHPELFYLDLTSFSLNTKCISIGSIKTYIVEIISKNDNYLKNDYQTEEEANIAIKQIEDIKNNIVNNLEGKNTYTKIKQVHDMLTETLEYTYDSENKIPHNIYGAFIEKKVVCEGYAKAFKYLMDSINVECILVSGTATNSSGEQEAHMWNYVKLDNNWYGVDVTWDDPIIVGGSDNKNSFKHNYFLKGYHTFYSSHHATGKISDKGILFTLPTLSTKSYG